jgi:hypothetical protein
MIIDSKDVLYGIEELRNAVREDYRSYEQEIQNPSNSMRAYYTGYLSALSAIEGLVAILCPSNKEVKDEDNN